jgi:low temperature requirement protein LtrA
MTQAVPRFGIRSRMAARDTGEQNRASSPLELLFDLTFAVAVAQIADQLAASIEKGNGLTAIVPFLMVFFAIWWAWMNFTWFASAYDTDDVPYRLMTLIQMAGVLVLAAGVPAAFNSENYLGITIGFLVMRVGLVGQWIRAAVESPAGRRTALRYAIGIGVIQAGWVARLWLPTARADQWWTVYLVFVVLVALEVMVPPWAERTGGITWHPHHIAERYGLFTIILLGETIAVLATGISEVVTAGDRVGPLVAAGVSALVLIFGLWWLYFLQPAGEGLEEHRDGSFFWGYGHYFVFAGLGSLGAGLQVVINYSGGHSTVAPPVVAWAVAIPVAVYLVALLVTHVRILPGMIVHVWIIAPAVLLVLVLPLLTNAFGVAIVFALITVVVAAAVAATLALGRHTFGAQQ